jgi:beta-N-acetylhexosaminidase
VHYLIRFALLLSMLIGGNVYAEPISLREKIGQMLILGFEGKSVDLQSPIIKAIKEDNIGGVILFDYNNQTKTFDKNIESFTQVRQLNADLQHAYQLANLKHHRPSLPLLISVDYEGGKVNRLKPEYGYPETTSAAEVGKMNFFDANKVANDMAVTLNQSGFNLNFAPVLDVNVNPDSPIIGKKDRSFSDNPGDVANYANLYSQNFLSHGVQCAYKHFPGHGSATGDSHLGFVDVSDTWQSQELEPYSQLLGQDQTCGMVMTAHVVNRQLDESGLPATLSHKILTDLLRKKLKFNGVIITDDMQMKAISAQYSLDKAVTLAINAGADMFIFGNQLSDQPQDPEQIIDLIEGKVKSGEISEKRINEAYRHIITMKKTIQMKD